MNIKYFSDTDTMYVQFNDHPVARTKDLDPNTVIDLDAQGQLVAMTVEHASKSATISEFSFQQLNSH